jgi:NADP-dependent 3-hydroxy acid dehydrogenase YdfG
LKEENQRSLLGRKAVVSGGASGIGKAVAQRLCSEGVFTSIADLPSAPSPALPANEAAVYSCDLTRASDVAAFYQNLRHANHLPDILVCNAGRGIQEKLVEGDPEKWQTVLDLNLMGSLRLIRAFVPDMLAAGTGDVVFISSVAAGQAYLYGGVYAASKAALDTVAETLRLETLPYIRVTIISPGVTQTPFFENTISGHQTAESIGYGSLAAEEVADAAFYALSRPPGMSVNQLTIRPRAQSF